MILERRYFINFFRILKGKKKSLQKPFRLILKNFGLKYWNVML